MSRIAAIIAGPIALGAIAVAAQSVEPVEPIQSFSDNCAACHQSDGEGIEGAFPALAGDKLLLGPAEAPIQVVLSGRGGMPTFRGDLSDAQIAAALSYARTSWGNKATPITADQVARQRGNVSPAKNTGH